jgi:hypothetical protein
VKIEFSRSGGIAYFPGLQRPVVIDTSRLAPAECEELKRFVAAAGFFDLPGTVGSPAKGAADYQQDVVTIADGTRSHTVRILVPCDQLALRNLVQAIQRHAKAARAGPKA